MDTRIAFLRNQLVNAAETLRGANSDFERLRDAILEVERSCQHQWGEPERKTEYHPAYYIKSDREMGIELGVDSQPGCHVPAKTDVWYERTCSRCGKIERTTRTKPAGVVPDFG